ncbi:MAG: L,D-transpeptidase family protein [Bacteroidales bacterium]
MTIKYKNTLIYTTAGLLILVLCYTLILILFSPKSPYTSVAAAREAITVLRNHKADKYLPLRYAMMTESYDSLLIKWRLENERFIFKRDYSEIKNLADTLIIKAKALTSESVSIGNNLDILLRNDLEAASRHFSRYDSIFSRIPIPQGLTEKYTLGKLLYIESITAFKNAELNNSFKKLQSATKLCNEATGLVREYLVSYFNHYDYWVNLVEDAIKTSGKRKDYVIIVDKFARSCQVYFAGKLKHTFETELGPNWIGDKRQRGDNTTPEGRYLVSKKLGPKQTMYYKALLINYPNDEDRKRFKDEIRNGTLPANSDIGGLIEIHGDGGKGFHWTNGCIALKNKDMDNVFRAASVGTPVVIVGSTKKLTELFNLD